LLLSYGANPNVADANKDTLLHLAVASEDQVSHDSMLGRYVCQWYAHLHPHRLRLKFCFRTGPAYSTATRKVRLLPHHRPCDLIHTLTPYMCTGKLVFDVCTPGSRVSIQRLIQSTINKNKHQTWGGRGDVVASKVTPHWISVDPCRKL
jgi:hypothetical protein